MNLSAVLPTIEAVANLQFIREIHLPLVMPGKGQSLPPITQKLTAMSLRVSGPYRDVVTQWIEQQGGHLQELTIVCLLLTVLLGNQIPSNAVNRGWFDHPVFQQASEPTSTFSRQGDEVFKFLRSHQ